MSKRQRTISGMALVLAASLASAASVHSRGLFMYSSLCAGEEDAHGEQIVLILGPEGASAIYTYAEGAIMAPLLAYGPNVKIDDRTGHVVLKFENYDVPPDANVKPEAYLIEGTISDEVLIVGSKKLPRIRTPSKELPKCVH